MALVTGGTVAIPERLPIALWKPLGTAAQIAATPTIVPRVLIFHTMVGYLQRTDTMFRVGAYDGLESTFGVGGPWDGAALDGVVWQWQSLVHGADAQWDGNAYANSVETSDGGNSLNPWSAKQLEALIVLTVQWCQATGNPAELVTSLTGHGIGYHRQFWEWNQHNHACPDDVRQAQLLSRVIPEAARRLANPTEASLSAAEVQEIKAHVSAVANQTFMSLSHGLSADGSKRNGTGIDQLAQTLTALSVSVGVEGTSPEELKAALVGLIDVDALAASIAAAIIAAPGSGTTDAAALEAAVETGVRKVLTEGTGGTP